MGQDKRNFDIKRRFFEISRYEKPGRGVRAGFLRVNPDWRYLEFLGSGVAEVGLEAEFRWEFGEAFMDVHFDTIVLAALFVGWFEGSTVGGAGEGEEFVEAVAEAAEGAVGAIDGTVGPACFVAVLFVFADDLFRDFDDTVEDVADGATQFPSGGVMGAWRRLNVSCCESGEGDAGSCYGKEFFHN